MSELKSQCPNCEKELSNHFIDKAGIEYCVNCWDYITYKKKECEDHNPVLVRYTHSNNTEHIRKQCLSCGELESKYYSRDSVKDISALPVADKSKIYSYENPDMDKLQELFKRYEKKSKINKQKFNFDKFLAEHSEYLKTDDWKKRRLLVLKRDNYLCQSCLENPAKEVHHKSYRYWKNEPLFELVSVCKTCHDSITEMNRNIVNFKRILLKD